MGILTDPSLSRRNQLGRNLVKHKRKICILLYAASLIWFCFLALKDYNHATYLSENALSPGLVYSEIRHNSAKFAALLYDELEAQRHIYKDTIPYTWIKAKMKQIGLNVFTHNFTLNYPFGGGKKFEGKNIYGILRAPRIGSTEGIVFSTPYRPPNSVNRQTSAGLALLLAFAEFASSKSYWAKDLIFLITDQEQLGMNAWLKAYHHDSLDKINALSFGSLEGRSGALQAAINFEFESLDVNDIDVKIEGLNGQLPNLDLFNLVQRLAHRENLFNNRHENRRRHNSGEFKENLFNMLSMITTQATGVPTGNHGLFHPYRIEALTIVGNKDGENIRKQVKTQTILKTIESISRSLNNLLERFHQSFFFYILVTDDRFVSIGDYMPCLGLIVGAILIKAFLLWLNLDGEIVNVNEIKSGDSTKQENKNVSKICIGLQFSEVGWIFIIAQGIGFAAYYLPQSKILSEFAYKNGITTETGIFSILGLLAIIGFQVPAFKMIQGYHNVELLHIIALLYFSSILIVIGLLNFSLGFLVAVITAPVVILFDTNQGKVMKSFNILYMLLLHPLIITYGVVTVLTFNNFPELVFTEILKRSFKATMDALTFSIVDLIVYENWLFRAATLAFFTSWILFWYLISIPHNTNHITLTNSPVLKEKPKTE